MAVLVDRGAEEWDPVNAGWIRRLALTVERILDVETGSTVTVEPDSFGYVHEPTGMVVSVASQFSVTRPDGTVDHYRLKTGRTRTDPTEAAILTLASGDGEQFFDLAAGPGTIEEIAPPGDPAGHLETAFDTSPTLTSETGALRPGWWCTFCDRSAVCGAYPSDPPGAVRWSSEAITLTKTDLEALGSCERRVAWRRIHQIPRDDGTDIDEERPLARGRLFHDLLAEVQVSDDQDAALEAFLRRVPPSEIGDLQTLWDHHRRLLRDEDIAVRRVEFPVGGSIRDPAGSNRWATIVGFADATTVDADGVPVVIEVKTGGGPGSEIEFDLYAMGIARWLTARNRTVERVRVHRHHVRRDGATCEVREYGPGDIEDAVEHLTTLVAPVLSWPWDDPLAPDFAVDAWCVDCEFRTTCENFRGGVIDADVPAFD